MIRFALLTSLVAGCWTGSQQAPKPKAPVDPDVAITLASVTLGDDCGDAAVIPPPARRAPSKPMPPADEAPGAAPRHYRMHCDQTSMQLAVRSTGGDHATTIQVKKVELLDKAGAVLGELESRMPTRWTDDGYVEWNQTVEANQTLQASYALSSPDWNKLTGSRWNAHSKTFQLRVTLVVGSKDRTVEKQSITPAMLEPPVPT
jgi:hypothetical protein